MLSKIEEKEIVYITTPKIEAILASLEGLEPTTRCLEGSRSIQLSYRDALTSLKCNMNVATGSIC